MNSFSSTSSSECICGECFNYATDFQSPSFRTRTPYYQNLGHPLIYYAQVPSPTFRKRSRETRKNNPNCFVKAFRWYTQERYPPQNQELPNDCTDLAGFAAWLDQKYDEFMLHKRAEQTAFQLQPTRGSQLEANQINPCVSCNPRQKEKRSRMKSPWRRRRRPSQSNESGDMLTKTRQSFEFILKPKELSHPTSECCHQIPSTESQASKKTIVKIKAHSSEVTMYEKRNELTRFEDRNIDSIKGDVKVLELPKQQTSTTKAFEEDPAGSRSSFKSVGGVTCQCPEEKIVTENAQTQCDSDVKHPTPDCNTCTGFYVMRNRSELPANLSEVLNMFHSNTHELKNNVTVRKVEPKHGARIQTQKNSTYKSEVKPLANVLCQCSEETTRKTHAHSQCQRDLRDVECCCTTDYELRSLSKASSNEQSNQPKTASSTKLVRLNPPLADIDGGTTSADKVLRAPCTITLKNGVVQTSDLSICLEKDAYPLFMKIVCADKLNEDSVRK